MTLSIHPDFPPQHRIQKAVNIVNNGGILIYPTDTVYGFGCSLQHKNSIERLYRLKNLEKYEPVSFICADLANAAQYAEISNAAFRIMRKLLPGPYTFVLPASREVPRLMLSRRKTVGIRIPNCAVSLAIVKTLGHPLLNTSVNDRDGELMGDPHLIEELYQKQVDLIIDSDILETIPSTVVDLTGAEPVILREGKGDVAVFK